MKRFFSYTGEWAGFDRHETADAARQAVKEAIKEAMATNGYGKPDRIGAWCWGEMMEAVQQEVTHIHDPECGGEAGCWAGYAGRDEGEFCFDPRLVAVPSPDLTRWSTALAGEVDRLRAELAQAREEVAGLRALVGEGLAIVEALSAGYGVWSEAARAASSPPVVAP